MLDRYGLYLCPVQGCPVIGTKPDARCPKHDKSLVRTVVQVESSQSHSRAKDRLDRTMRNVRESMGL